MNESQIPVIIDKYTKATITSIYGYVIEVTQDDLTKNIKLILVFDFMKGDLVESGAMGWRPFYEEEVLRDHRQERHCLSAR